MHPEDILGTICTLCHTGASRDSVRVSVIPHCRDSVCVVIASEDKSLSNECTPPSSAFLLAFIAEHEVLYM